MRVGVESVVIVAGGHPCPGDVPALPSGAYVIAADAGVDLGLALGLRIDRAIGDFDSVSAGGLAAAEAAGATVERHPAAKDATDLELALDAAIALAPKRILVVGSAGGRLDHLLGSILLLADARYAAATVDASLDGNRIAVIRGSRTLTGTPGEIVTLLPVHGPAEKVSTSGLEYPLHGETLTAGTTRGVSNVFAAAEAEITVVGGCVVAVQPGPEREESL
jgi:thiamine pyrophosphokinase